MLCPFAFVENGTTGSRPNRNMSIPSTGVSFMVVSVLPPWEHVEPSYVVTPVEKKKHKFPKIKEEEKERNYHTAKKRFIARRALERKRKKRRRKALTFPRLFVIFVRPLRKLSALPPFSSFYFSYRSTRLIAFVFCFGLVFLYVSFFPPALKKSIVVVLM